MSLITVFTQLQYFHPFTEGYRGSKCYMTYLFISTYR
jgi:hypothetical protein